MPTMPEQVGSCIFTEVASAAANARSAGPGGPDKLNRSPPSMFSRPDTPSTSPRKGAALRKVASTTVRRSRRRSEFALHQRIQAAGRFVEYQQWSSGGEGRDQRNLLPVAGGVGTAGPVEIKVKPIDELGPVAGVDAWTEIA